MNDLVRLLGEQAPTMQGLLAPARQALDCDALIVWQRNGAILEVANAEIVELDAEALAERLEKSPIDMHVGKGLAGLCCAEFKALNVPDLRDELSLRVLGLHVVHQSFVESMGWRSAIFQPLQGAGDAVGVVAAYSSEVARFDSGSEAMLRIVGDRAVARLRPERLFEKLQDRLDVVGEVLLSLHDVINAAFWATAQIEAARDSLTTSPDAAREHLGHARSNAKKANKLASNALKLRGTKRPKPRRRNLYPILSSVVDDRQRAAKSEGVRLVLKCPEKVSAVIREEELARAVANVIDNAIEFHRLDTHNRDRYVEVTASSEDVTTTIRITDNGPGIHESFVGRVFHFGVTGKGSSGHGLGLFQAQLSVEAVGGAIHVVSELGSHTTFQLDLYSGTGGAT